MSTPDYDMIIIGAGISGIGAGCHMRMKNPDKSFAILEGRDNFGGTWDLFKYPGIRSDSDMHTLGFSFKPWIHEKSIADGPSIMDYLEETIAEYDLAKDIHYNHWVTKAEWDTDTARWTVTASLGDERGETRLTCNFLYVCSGYYKYDEGYLPEFKGYDDFKGQIIHPQHWPEDLDYTGKKVVVVGSGATAMTIVPAMSDKAEKITMLQRSPTYVVSRPAADSFANGLRKVLPKMTAYNVTRWKNTLMQHIMYTRMRNRPEQSKESLLNMAKKELPETYVDKHFTPSYNPWDQRMCLIPDSDLFNAINNEKADVVTAHIDSFSEKGIRLTNGEELEADIIVTATGLNLVVLGEMDIVVDGEAVDISKTWSYKGMAYSDLPNLVSSFGYINASWTLRADLTSEYVCRLINHMDETNTRQCTPRLRAEDKDMPEYDWIQDFSSGYMQRVMHLMPKQSDREPWLNPQNYRKDKVMFLKRPVDDGVMLFDNPALNEQVSTSDKAPEEETPVLAAAE